MDNVVLVTFEDEGKAYEEFNRLKDNEATPTSLFWKWR